MGRLSLASTLLSVGSLLCCSAAFAQTADPVDACIEESQRFGAAYRANVRVDQSNLFARCSGIARQTWLRWYGQDGFATKLANQRLRAYRAGETFKSKSYNEIAKGVGSNNNLLSTRLGLVVGSNGQARIASGWQASVGDGNRGCMVYPASFGGLGNIALGLVRDTDWDVPGLLLQVPNQASDRITFTFSSGVSFAYDATVLRQGNLAFVSSVEQRFIDHIRSDWTVDVHIDEKYFRSFYLDGSSEALVKFAECVSRGDEISDPTETGPSREQVASTLDAGTVGSRNSTNEVAYRSENWSVGDLCRVAVHSYLELPLPPTVRKEAEKGAIVKTHSGNLYGCFVTPEKPKVGNVSIVWSDDAGNERMAKVGYAELSEGQMSIVDGQDTGNPEDVRAFAFAKVSAVAYETKLWLP